MFVNTASSMPKVSEWEKLRVADVLTRARPLNIPASNRGQHQLPTSAGMDSSSVSTAAQTDLGSTSAVAEAGPSPVDWSHSAQSSSIAGLGRGGSVTCAMRTTAA
eukprot:CAMPEP_0195154538 /NCGR_PEP_ID=MMETSP0448-20130528/183703_1 /TAXON_ID=66468 /ORGANISM="Heterocapsa triquestra, Strain CCMP 448" /LENGTH=104 /DNA_ID=CAMNT_0040193311 /DNA_START=1688 /DNA_END=2002 /DNA_ORIENTATION=-